MAVEFTDKDIKAMKEALDRGSDIRIERTKYGIRIIELKVKVLSKHDESK